MSVDLQSPKTEAEIEADKFSDEVETIGGEITVLTQRLGGLSLLPITRSEMMAKFKELYEARKAKINRLSEIAKLSVEKGYVKA